MGDAPTKSGGRGKFLVGVHGVVVAGHPGKQDDIGIGHCFAVGGRHANMEVFHVKPLLLIHLKPLDPSKTTLSGDLV